MNLKSIVIPAESPFSADAVFIINELSNCLQNITGDSGKSSFDTNDVCNNKSMFVIARSQSGKAIGCGAFRPIDEATVEVKKYMQTKKMWESVINSLLP